MSSEGQTRRSLFSTLVKALRNLMGKRREPEDPYHRRPVRTGSAGPSSRSGAAAVAEPEEENGFFPPRKP
jgi:hypothetical protein